MSLGIVLQYKWLSYNPYDDFYQFKGHANANKNDSVDMVLCT